MVQCNCGNDMKLIWSKEDSGTETKDWIYQCKKCGIIAILTSQTTNIKWELLDDIR